MMFQPKTVLIGLIGSFLLTGPSLADEQTVRLDASPASLYGTLTLPNGAANVAAVLILPGSGPTDRDGNFPGGANNSLKMLSAGLANKSIASLRIDKRGIGASQAAAPNEKDLWFGTYVDDAIHWLELLRSEPRVTHVFILGHSEGALIATLAAQHTSLDGLILISGAGEPAGIVIRHQLNAAQLSPALMQSAEQTLSALEKGRLVPNPPEQLAALFRPSVQPYLISWLPIDPVAELARVSSPVLVIQGTTDIQVTTQDARLLASAKPGIGLVYIDGMNHVLKSASLDRAKNIATYSDPSLPLAPELVSRVADFVHTMNRER